LVSDPSSEGKSFVPRGSTDGGTLLL
jgi:hypothetical protein